MPRFTCTISETEYIIKKNNKRRPIIAINGSCECTYPAKALYYASKVTKLSTVNLCGTPYELITEMFNFLKELKIIKTLMADSCELSLVPKNIKVGMLYLNDRIGNLDADNIPDVERITLTRNPKDYDDYRVCLALYSRKIEIWCNIPYNAKEYYGDIGSIVSNVILDSNEPVSLNHELKSLTWEYRMTERTEDIDRSLKVSRVINTISNLTDLRSFRMEGFMFIGHPEKVFIDRTYYNLKYLKFSISNRIGEQFVKELIANSPNLKIVELDGNVTGITPDMFWNTSVDIVKLPLGAGREFMREVRALRKGFRLRYTKLASPQE